MSVCTCSTALRPVSAAADQMYRVQRSSTCLRRSAFQQSLWTSLLHSLQPRL